MNAMRRSLFDQARRRHARRGAAALEAVIILPLMLFLIIAGVEMYLYIRVIGVMDRVAFSLANSISLQTSMTGDSSSCTSPDHLCTYQTLMPTLAAPLNPADISVRFSVFATNAPAGAGSPASAWKAISSPNNGWSKIAYQGANAPAPAGKITPSSLPASLISGNTQTADTLIAVEVFLKYQPMAISGAVFDLLFNTEHYSRTLMRPRYADLCTLEDEAGASPAVCGS
jgi:Flp pilus assembly protein TadG